MDDIKPDITPASSAENPSADVKKRPWGKICLLSAAALICVFALFFFLPLFTGEARADTIIRIPRDATSRNVADSVAKYLGEDYASKVMRAASLRGADFSKRHGAYLIPEGTSPAKAANQLTKGAQQPVTITINGFRVLGNLASRLERRIDFTAEEFMTAASDENILKEYGLDSDQALSLFIDDSYDVYWSSTPEDVIRKVGAHYKNVWNEERVRKAADLGLTPAEVMTICSIVDEETNKLDEKGSVGRLYINRLNKGMRLQADPTVRFANGDFTIRRVRGEHLKVDSPYNTYRYAGLPPGPIRTTSATTVDLILKSEPNDYIFMCAKEDFSGRHNFASSYADHQANARRYQQALDARGIK